jgi:hypothetical protein
MKQLLIAALMAATMGIAATNAVARGNGAMVEPARVTVTNAAGQAPGLEAMRTAIVKGGAKRRWVIRSEKPGEVVLSFDKERGKHVVDVAVAYDADSYEIRYVSSVGMRYEIVNGVSSIHPFYNKWVDSLSQDIQDEIRR